MVTKEKAVSWILEYCCRHKHYNIVTEFMEVIEDSLLRDYPGVCIHVSCAMIQKAVQSADEAWYPQVIQHLDFIWSSCPEAVSFTVYSKLITGLKEKVLLNMLRNDKGHILTELDQYFPIRSDKYKGVRKTSLQKTIRAEKDFHDFFIPLFIYEDKRLTYFQDDYMEEYGAEFHNALCKLVTMFVERIYSHLPPSVIDKLISNGCDEYLPLAETSPALKLLLHEIRNESSLQEKALKRIFMALQSADITDNVNLGDQGESEIEEELITNENRNLLPEPIQYDGCAVETFNDFNDKRHLFQKSEKEQSKKDNSDRKCEQKSDALIISSSESDLKSSSESLLLLQKRNVDFNTCNKIQCLHERGDASRSENAVKESIASVVRESFVNESCDPVILESSKDESCSAPVVQEPFVVKETSNDESCSPVVQEISIDKSYVPVVQEFSIDESCACVVQESSIDESCAPDVKEVEEHDVNWNIYEELSQRWTSPTCSGDISNPEKKGRCSSIADVEEVGSDDEFIPPSYCGDMELWDVFSNDGDGDSSACFSSIHEHMKDDHINLCVVKLYRSFEFDGRSVYS